nr:NrfD/PsrC family molybdoenzyme membrane anchor subunit [uncultured Sulfurimonas sp.]
MEKYNIAGIEINKVSLYQLFFNKTMLLSYVLLAFGLFGIYEIVNERYFLLTANAFDAGLNQGSHDVALAMKEAIFGHGGEVKRESPWTLYIVNYMYMIYTGSGIIFIVTIGEIFNLQIIKKTAVGFLTLGLCMVFGGLFTIVFDLNMLNMLWMLITPNVGSGMWLMLPLYLVYIPFVMFEIYLLKTDKKKMVKKIAWIILFLGIGIDIAEYYIQARLFDMNTARHLWTTYPILPLYFILSSFLAASGAMILYSYLNYKDELKGDFDTLVKTLRRFALILIVLVASYEAVAFLFIDKKWATVILFEGYAYQFYIYTLLAIAFPILFITLQLIKRKIDASLMLLASLSIIVGTYIGRYIFVYGGNAYPLSDRFGTGFQKYGEYDIINSFISNTPPIPEICIVIGSVGVVLGVYKFLDILLDISKVHLSEN